MSVRFVFDYRSPFSYLANSQLAGLGASSIDFHPVDVLHLMENVNNQPSSKCPNKLRYAFVDAARWADVYGVPMQPNRAFFASPEAPQVARLMLQGALAARAHGVFAPYHAAIFDAMWGTPRDLISLQGRLEVLAAKGLDAQMLWDVAADPALKDQLALNDERAAAAGAFGVPTFFVGSEIFFGNDRLDMVRERIAALDASGRPAALVGSTA